MTPADLMAKAVEAAAETHTTVAWLNIAADALAAARADTTLNPAMAESLLRSESMVLAVLMLLRRGL